jgi:hypothetical protein
MSRTLLLKLECYAFTSVIHASAAAGMVRQRSTRMQLPQDTTASLKSMLDLHYDHGVRCCYTASVLLLNAVKLRHV